MDMTTELRQSFHENGTLFYEETICRLNNDQINDFPNRILSPKGYSFIRTGRVAKYFDNGQLAWELNYDKKGELIKDDSRQYRKDGTVIEY